MAIATLVYIILNGSFGVGKTTVARELRRLLPGSCMFDPEKIGVGLKYLPGYKSSDFQHLRSWRRLTIAGARLAGRVRRTVIIPMAFSDLKYLREITAGIESRDRPVRHYCLTAPLSIIEERLASRGEVKGDPRWSWVYRRAAECCAAHQHSSFAVHVSTERSTPEAIALEIAGHFRGATTAQESGLL